MDKGEILKMMFSICSKHLYSLEVYDLFPPNVSHDEIDIAKLIVQKMLDELSKQFDD